MKDDHSIQVLRKALDGDIHAFQNLFGEFQNQLKSYLFRLLANRSDAEDITHDTFIRAFDQLKTFRGESSLKTWTFQIATNLAKNYLNRRRRWTENVSEEAKMLVLKNEELRMKIQMTHENAANARYDMKEHIDTCFTCISKNLPIENQVALMLKDIYDFTVPEIEQILGKTEGVIKYLIQDGRKTMSEIFDKRCALINKTGVCHQCSELNGWFNPKQNTQSELMKLELVKKSKRYDRQELFNLRAQLVKAIDPLRSPGSDLQEILLRCNRMAMGEEPVQ